MNNKEIINLERELFLNKERVRKNIFMTFSEGINLISNVVVRHTIHCEY